MVNHVVGYLRESPPRLFISRTPMIETLLLPINWSMTYGPQELENWNDRLSICQQVSACSYYEDADDYMEYTSSEVI